jgi:cardiolipin synthase (CMP-forming)
VRYLPNIISILRIILVAPTLYYLWLQHFTVALGLFFIAGLSDGVDGYLARRFNWRTRLGTYLDPIGDKLLLVGCYFVLGLMTHLPIWLVSLVIGRDIIIVIGAALYRYAIKDAAMEPLLISKLNTVCQILLVVVLLYSLSDLPLATMLPAWLLQAVIVIVTLTTILSGVAYIQSWWHRIVAGLHKKANA